MSDIRKKKQVETPEEDNPWRKRISRMRRYQEKHSKTWRRNTHLLFGATKEGETENQVAYGWSLVKSLETAIYVQNPDMVVESYTDDRRERGKILTNVANYDIDQMDLKAAGNMCLIDTFTCGYGAVIELLESDKRTCRYPETDEKGKEDEAEAKKVDEEEVEDLKDQRYVVRRIDPKDLLLPEGGRLLDLSDIPYLAVAFYPTIAELKDDPKFKVPDDVEQAPDASDLSNELPKEAAKSGDTRDQAVEKDPAFKRVLCWEIHDKVNSKIIYMLGYKSKIMCEIPWAAKFKIGGRTLFPVTVLAMNPVPNQWYPKPEVDLIAHQLIMLNRMDQLIYKDAADKWRKYASWADVLPSDQAGKVTDTTGDTVQLILLDPSQMDRLAGGSEKPLPAIGDIIGELKDPSPKRDLFPVREMIKQEINDILGYGPPASGGMPKTRSAREAVAIKERQEQRLGKRADAVGDFYRSFGQKHILFLQQTMLLERYVRIFSRTADLAEWRQYSKDDIGGDFNFIVFAGTSAPRTTEAYRNSEMQLFQNLMPLIQTGQIPYEPVILRLAEAFQWRGVDALLKNYKPAVEQLAMVLAAMQTQPNVPPNVLPEAAAAVVQAVLTPEQISMVAKKIAGAAAAGPGGGGGRTPPNTAAKQEAGDQNPMGTETATM